MKNEGIGDWQLKKLIGQGNNASVWLATNINDQSLAALKITDSVTAERNYAAMTLVEHPNITRPTAIFSHQTQGVVVMPLCIGRSVEGLAGYTSEQWAWRLLTDIAPALAALHAAGMAHGNVCLENILWDGDKFMLTGFTNSRMVADGGRPADDIWQLGATVFYLCMGCHVFNGMGMKAQRPLSPLPYMRKSMPRLSELVQRCLAYNGRPSAQEVTDMAEKGQASYIDKDRQHKVAPTTSRRLKTDFWPDEMRRVLMILIFTLCSLTMMAQTIESDKELSDLVSLVVNLRDNYSIETYKMVSNRLGSDKLWTQMSELDGPLREGECFLSGDMKYYRLNKVLDSLERARDGVFTPGYALNGEDREHKYSLYECAVKAQAMVSYDMEGRKGAQCFVVIPFNGNGADITAKATIDGVTRAFLLDAERGILTFSYKGDLTWVDRFKIDIINSSAENQAFVIINFNTMKQ